MKKTLIAFFVSFVFCSSHGQDFNSMAGDWIRVGAEYQDGGQLPANHGSRLMVRYHFTKKQVYQIIGAQTVPGAYTRTGNVLKIEPLQTLIIESYSDKELTLVEAKSNRPVRYYMIPTDSFQVSGRLRYPYEVVEGDTIYSSTPGIDPIYPKGQNEFMSRIMGSFGQEVGFNFTYVVQKDGTIGDVSIKASTNPKLNKRLVQLVRKSSGDWIPASYKGKPINVRQDGALGFNAR